MTVSIALCTYNGARYLQEQLDSIAAQTLLPDEMVVCDDGSQDETVPILQNFAAHVPFPVHITVNSVNLGSTQNFAQAVSLCRHDLIFLCDQDDVWRADKIEMMHSVFAARPEVGLVFTDADVVNEHLMPLGKQLWSYALFTLDKQQWMRQGKEFDVLLAYNHVTGATLAFRASLCDVVLPIPGNIGLIHDGWIALMTAAVMRVAALDTALILYRQHEAQQMGTRGGQRPKVLPHAYYRAHLNQLETVASRLHHFQAGRNDPLITRRSERIQAQIRHLQRRLALPAARWRRLPRVLLELAAGGYHRFSNGWRSFARDLFY